MAQQLISRLPDESLIRTINQYIARPYVEGYKFMDSYGDILAKTYDTAEDILDKYVEDIINDRMEIDIDMEDEQYGDNFDYTPYTAERNRILALWNRGSPREFVKIFSVSEFPDDEETQVRIVYVCEEHEYVTLIVAESDIDRFRDNNTPGIMITDIIHHRMCQYHHSFEPCRCRKVYHTVDKPVVVVDTEGNPIIEEEE